MQLQFLWHNLCINKRTEELTKGKVFSKEKRKNVDKGGLKKIEKHMEKEDFNDENPDLITFKEVLPTIEQLTQLLIDEAMKRVNGDQTIAAGMLGISRQTFEQTIQKTQIRSVENTNGSLRSNQLVNLIM